MTDKQRHPYNLTLEYHLQSRIGNDALRPGCLNTLGMSLEGCAYRGTVICHRCPLAEHNPPVVCDYRCQIRNVDCEHRAGCKCGHDQTARLRAGRLVE